MRPSRSLARKWDSAGRRPWRGAEGEEVASCEGGSHKHNAKKHVLEWTLPLIDKDSKTANLEFVVAGSNEAAFFPVAITFSSDDTICPIHVAAVTQVDTSEPAKFGLYRNLTTEKYEIVASAE